MNRVAILGAGSWGTALAVHLAREGRVVSLWARNDALITEMIARQANTRYLADVVLPSSVAATSSLPADLQDALKGILGKART